MFKDSESNHLNNFILTGILDTPTSTNVNVANIVVISTHPHVINWEPMTPTFLPKNPATIEPSKGKIKILKYII